MNITELIHTDRLFADVVRAIGEGRRAPKPLPLIVNGLSGGALDAFCVEVTRALRDAGDTPVLFLAPDEGTAAALCARLSGAGVAALHFPSRDLVFYEYSASHDTERERLFALHMLLSGQADAVVATPAAAAGYTVPPGRLSTMSLSLSVGQTLPPDDLSARLTALGYTRTEFVEAAGQFARRGGIFDLWALAGQEPLRVEFFGDEVDRMCHFDPLSQRLIDTCESFLLLPAHEVLPDAAALRAIRAEITAAGRRADATGAEELARTLAALDGAGELCCRDRYLSLIYPEKTTLLDYFGETPPVFLLGTNETTESLHNACLAREEVRESLVARGILTEKTAVWEEDERTWNARLTGCLCVHINAFTGGTFQREGGIFGFRCRRLPTYADAPKALTDDLSAFLRENYLLFLLCENRAGVTSVVNYLSDLGIRSVPASPDLTRDTLERGVVYATAEGEVSAGFELLSARLAVLSLCHDSAEENRRHLRAQKRKRHSAGQTILSYAELSPGNLVVHEKYGIGVFEGLESITRDGVTQDYITIRYAGTDKLFIPADRLEAVTKYIGAGSEGDGVKLSHMGGTAWTKAKSRAKGAAKEMAHELIALYAARSRQAGISFPPSPAMEAEFADNFDYPLTESQEEAIADILRDMEKPSPMDRLLCGDVGFGKTEVALRAAFRAITAGYQVALLVPTTILALQHYQTALSRFRGFAVQVDMLSRFRTAKEQKAILRRLARGETDLIVGTHALLGQGVKFRRPGLLIIDEEQRFGVAQKEKIKGLASDLDVLTLTATPIPRTLNMAMNGIRDMSILDEAPGERHPVETYVLEYNEDAIAIAIRRELARAGQVLYLYNRTEQIDLVAGKLQSHFPGARVACAHGQMEREQIEDIWQALVRGEIDILVCTTIIETGVDLPNANTLVIENADRLGLAQLHQIRGRIGRSTRQAYAYFTYRAGKALSDIAQKRLTAIREYAAFGAGFRIALRDLEIRGAGDLLGASQHGHIESVGYDLYVHLLESAVLEEQGKAPAPVFESTIDLKLDANIPASYIASSTHRMEMYKKISKIETEADREDILDEFCDRFGDPPKPTQRLLSVALARATAARCRIVSVIRVERELRITPAAPDLPVWSELFLSLDGFRTPTSRAPYLTLTLRPGTDPAQAAATALCAYEAAIKKIQEEQSNEESAKGTTDHAGKVDPRD